MHNSCLVRTAAIAAALAALSGCAPSAPPVQYQNTAHQDYGAAEFNRDNVQCRDQNSTKQVIPGYEDKVIVTVDEAKANACLAAKGWHPKS
jgi:hypothetical protein